MKTVKKIQIGKNGLTPEVFEQIKKIFNSSERVKVELLKSACRDRKMAVEIGEKIIEGLGKNFTFKLVGYVLTVQKWRKARR